MNKMIAKYCLYYPVTFLKGERVARYIPDYDRFQYSPSTELEKYRREKLVSILNYAKENSNYYRDILSDSEFNEASIDSDILKIPLLSKETIIAKKDRIRTPLAKNASIKTTGGSTGEPVRIYKNSDALARERAATWRSYSWAGVGIGDKQARFWGVPRGGLGSAKSKLIDFISNRYRISAFNITEDSLDSYYKDLVRFKPKYLYGYVSAILALTNHITMNKLDPLSSLVSIITTSEVLTYESRTAIESCWGVKVFNEYGCGEVGSIAHECEYGQLHLMSDNLHLEILAEDGNPATTGEIVVTDYFNKAMPLIRYRVGDYATVLDEQCKCGRSLPVITKIHGRAYDLIKTGSGKKIHPEAILYIFEDLQKKVAGFSQFQVVQESLNAIHINIVKAKDWDDRLPYYISEAVKKEIDANMKCSFSYVNIIPREPSGKMRVVKSNI